MIIQKKWQKLRAKMKALGIDESKIKEKFILSSGRGGQKVQKTASCVYLKYLPTGMQVKCQESRLRETNRYYARRRLCDRIDTLINQEQSEKQKAIEKIRRQKRRRSRKAKEKILEQKRARAKIKALRKKPSTEE